MNAPPKRFKDPQTAFGAAVQNMNAGRLDLAASAASYVVECHPTHAGALHLLGVIEFKRQDLTRALDLLGRAAAIDPNNPAVHGNLGRALCMTGAVAQGIASFRTAVAIDPRLPEAHYSLGTALKDIGNLVEAESSYRAALRLRANFPEAHNNLGIVLADLGRFEDAAVCFAETVRLKPDHPSAFNNLGNALNNLGRFEQAEACCRKALAISPNTPWAHDNLGIALSCLGRHQEAEACYREALRLDPDYARSHLHLSFALLVQGRLEEGWREHDWRWQVNLTRRDLPQPQWNGEHAGRPAVLVYTEQGFGDSIQFCRYVPLLAEHARIIFEVPRPLAKLMSGLQGIEQIVVRDDPLPAFDFQCPLLTLPRLLRTTLETVPGKVPYLQAVPADTAAWQRRLADLPGLRVGLVWSGDPRSFQPGANAIDRRRSITLAHFAQLADLPDISFVSLQKGEPASQTRCPPPGLQIHDWTGELDDFAATAALIAGLDLVISVDTSVVHLAGALGKPVWLLNRFDTCWRWLLGRDDSPWYPSLRQFRQTRPGEWDGVLSQVRAALAARPGGHAR
jgi:tetratricopeptide (TPR) repeat protein